MEECSGDASGQACGMSWRVCQPPDKLMGNQHTMCMSGCITGNACRSEVALPMENRCLLLHRAGANAGSTHSKSGVTDSGCFKL